MSDSLVLYEVVDHIAVVTLNHPAKRNPLSRAMLGALKERLDGIAADATVRVVVIRAAGPAFSAGHDLRELVGAGAAECESLFALCTDVMETIHTLPQPVIASVHGIATAAGCQLVASCDLVVASETAKFATPGVKIGLFCTTPAVPLSRVIGSKKAMEMLLTGEPISAAVAERAGLVNRVVPSERLADETMKLARQIAAQCGATVGLGKRSFHEQLRLDRTAAYQFAERVMTANAQAADAREGIAAFLEKRPARWTT